jgi:exosortase
MRSGWKWIIPAALLAYVYYPTFLWMVDRWNARDSYYAHGFLIPLISLYWLFKKRETFLTCEKKEEAKGLASIAGGAFLQLASSLFRVYFLSAISLVILLLGIVYYAFGRKALRESWFPISFLFLMIPLPLLVISQVTLEMKFFVSEISTLILNTIGISAIREGSYIYTPNAVVLVGDPCSGLRSFLAFLCLGFVFAYGSGLNTWKKGVLVVAGLPLAVLSNVIRVFAMGWLAEVYGMQLISTKVIHDGAGVVVFVIALVSFLILRRKLEAIRA